VFDRKPKQQIVKRGVRVLKDDARGAVMGRVGNRWIHQKLLANDSQDAARGRDQALEVAGQFSRSGVRSQKIRIVKANVNQHLLLYLSRPPWMAGFTISMPLICVNSIQPIREITDGFPRFFSFLTKGHQLLPFLGQNCIATI
jgi:hypothetical protein